MPSGRGKITDKYANSLNIEVEMSAANTLTFKQVNIGLPLYEKAAFLLHKVQFYITAYHASLLASADSLEMALVNDNSITTITPERENVYCYMKKQAIDQGTPANFLIETTPFCVDYSGFPNGGLLIPIYNLYGAMTTAGYANAAEGIIKVYFTVVQLNAAEFWELVESYRGWSA